MIPSHSITPRAMAPHCLAMAPLLLASLFPGHTAANPSLVSPLERSSTSIVWHQLSTGASHTCGLTTAGSAYCWGKGMSGQLGIGDISFAELKPTAVDSNRVFSSIAAGNMYTCALTSVGEVYCWGYNQGNLLGTIDTAELVLSPSRVDISISLVSLSVGDFHVCGISDTNRAYCWGYNADGALGTGDSVDRMQPTEVVGGIAFKAISVGASHTCGLDLRGHAYCWGANDIGALGTADFYGSEVPVPVTGDLVFRSITAGLVQSCGILEEDHTGFCWGGFALGTGDDRYRLVPTIVGAGNLNFASMSAGRWHTCAVTMDGEPFCWGENGYWQLGLGASGPERALTPTSLGRGTLFSSVQLGAVHTCGIAIDGRALCWGDGQRGKLGTCSDDAEPEPTVLAAPSDVCN